jgi:hypothetical protein
MQKRANSMNNVVDQLNVIAAALRNSVLVTKLDDVQKAEIRTCIPDSQQNNCYARQIQVRWTTLA